MFEASDKYIREQKVFARAILDNDITFLENHTNGLNTLNLKGAINLYHEDYCARLQDALIENYINTFLLFPNEFNKIAENFVKKNKSRSYNLNNYGTNFPNYIKETSYYKEKPEVYDLANLEHCFTLLYHAKEQYGMLPDELSKTGFGEDNILELIPNLYLFNSNFAIYRWWKDQSLKNKDKGTPFFIYKTTRDINFYQLTKYQYQILFNLILGNTITVSINAAKSNLTEDKRKGEVSSLFAFLSSERLISGVMT